MRPLARVNEIDLLRFIAAMAVVFFHYSFRGYAAGVMPVMPYPAFAPLSKYGYLGVELFFMISGFVILMTAAGGSLRKFLVSRIVRLYLAFWACCTLTFAVTAASGDPRFSTTMGHYLGNMTMLSGFFGVPLIDGAYCSLLVELGVAFAVYVFIEKRSALPLRSAFNKAADWTCRQIPAGFRRANSRRAKPGPAAGIVPRIGDCLENSREEFEIK